MGCSYCSCTGLRFISIHLKQSAYTLHLEKPSAVESFLSWIQTLWLQRLPRETEVIPVEAYSRAKNKAREKLGLTGVPWRVDPPDTPVSVTVSMLLGFLSQYPPTPWGVSPRTPIPETARGDGC